MYQIKIYIHTLEENNIFNFDFVESANANTIIERDKLVNDFIMSYNNVHFKLSNCFIIDNKNCLLFFNEF